MIPVVTLLVSSPSTLWYSPNERLYNSVAFSRSQGSHSYEMAMGMMLRSARAWSAGFSLPRVSILMMAGAVESIPSLLRPFFCAIHTDWRLSTIR